MQVECGHTGRLTRDAARRAAESGVRTYTAGKAAGGGGQEQPDTREWVFGLLATAALSRRMEQLERLDLRRRPGCEPCLRALVMDEWTPDALYHMGWCESCRSAAIALGMHAPAAAGAPGAARRRLAGGGRGRGDRGSARRQSGHQHRGSQARGTRRQRARSVGSRRPHGRARRARPCPARTAADPPVTPVPRSRPSRAMQRGAPRRGARTRRFR